MTGTYGTINLSTCLRICQSAYIYSSHAAAEQHEQHMAQPLRHTGSHDGATSLVDAHSVCSLLHQALARVACLLPSLLGTVAGLGGLCGRTQTIFKKISARTRAQSVEVNVHMQVLLLPQPPLAAPPSRLRGEGGGGRRATVCQTCMPPIPAAPQQQPPSSPTHRLLGGPHGVAGRL